MADAARWKDVLPAIVGFVGDDVAVAHNAGFDIGVIRYACALDNIEWPELRFLCTLVMARRAMALPTYRLPFLAETMGIAFDDHHDALADATAVVDVVARLAEKQHATDLLGLAGLSALASGAWVLASTAAVLPPAAEATWRASSPRSRSTHTPTPADTSTAKSSC